MDTFWIVLAVLVGLALAGAVPILLILASKVYETLLVRTSPDKWGRECSAPENQEHLQMWQDGVAWREAHSDVIREVTVENEGLTLYGEFVDFGGDRCVVILPGRGECLTYSYHFAAPYAQAGCNVLVVDMRCHGKSDGVYSTVGIGEGRDLLAWLRLLTEQLGQKEIYLHGVCMGTVSALTAMLDPACPDCVAGLVTDGCFVSFRETFRRHMIAGGHPVHPVLDLVMLSLLFRAGVNVYRDKPISMMKRLDVHTRILFLYGEQDVFSVPEKSRELFAACAAREKQIVWFDKGGHSHLRINDTARYDAAIIGFLEKR